MIAVAYTKLLRRKRLLEPTQTAFHILAAGTLFAVAKCQNQKVPLLVPCVSGERTQL